jgi:putative endopeptidase
MKTALLLLALAVPAHAALDPREIDPAIDACTDFYGHVNGRWIASTAIPEDRSSWGTFAMVQKHNEDVLLAALAEGVKNRPAPGSAERKGIDFFASGMDVDTIQAAGLAPIEQPLTVAGGASDVDSLASALAMLHGVRIRAGFRFDVRADARDATRYLAQLVQDGLGLPDRDYYFRDDERSRTLRAMYLEHVARLFVLAGDSAYRANENAAAVMDLETALAKASMDVVEKRDPEKTYNRLSIAELERLAPGFPWRAYLKALGARDVAQVNVAQPAFFRAFAELAGKREPAQWRTYLRWQVLHAAAPFLPRAFAEADFDFFQRELRGRKVAPARDGHVLDVISGRYGEEPMAHAVAQVFVARAFPQDAKARATDLVRHVKKALATRLADIDWMGEATRKRALEKLDAMNIKVGYPDRWRDYSDAALGDYVFAGNWLRANAFDHRRLLARIGKPVDRGDWWMAPHIVNAYYSRELNEIVFPAGILQPPFFDAKADDALNYGAIGAVIGHEITHGFDDNGRRFDARGNMTDWWTPEDARGYLDRARRIEQQYGAYEGIEGLRVNGKLTLGENISDVGGLKIAYLALQDALAGKPREAIDGLTPEQRFFLAFARIWRAAYRPAYERLLIQTNSHSPARFRVRGAIAHRPEFGKAFGCAAPRTASSGGGAEIW